jgi:hypothetical protein
MSQLVSFISEGIQWGCVCTRRYTQSSVSTLDIIVWFRASDLRFQNSASLKEKRSFIFTLSIIYHRCHIFHAIKKQRNKKQEKKPLKAPSTYYTPRIKKIQNITINIPPRISRSVSIRCPQAHRSPLALLASYNRSLFFVKKKNL